MEFLLILSQFFGLKAPPFFLQDKHRFLTTFNRLVFVTLPYGYVTIRVQNSNLYRYYNLKV